MMLTQPSLQDSTNNDIRAWRGNTEMEVNIGHSCEKRAAESDGSVPYLDQVVEVVLPPYPAVISLQTV